MEPQATRDLEEAGWTSPQAPAEDPPPTPTAVHFPAYPGPPSQPPPFEIIPFEDIVASSGMRNGYRSPSRASPKSLYKLLLPLVAFSLVCIVHLVGWGLLFVAFLNLAHRTMYGPLLLPALMINDENYQGLLPPSSMWGWGFALCMLSLSTISAWMSGWTPRMESQQHPLVLVGAVAA